MKILVVLLFFFLSLLKAQQVDTTTINFEEIFPQGESPLKFRLEYTPRDTENPNIEYDDLQAPYQLYISSELLKLKPNYQPMMLLQDLSKIDLRSLFYKSNYYSNLYVKNLQSKTNLEFNAELKKLMFKKDNFDVPYLYSNYYLSHYIIIEKLIFKNEISYQSQNLDSSIRQINYDLEIKKILNRNFILSISPFLQYDFSEELNINYFFSKNDVNLDVLLNDKTMASLGVSLLNDFFLFNTNIIIKNFPLENFYLNSILSLEKDTKKIYYQTKFSKSMLGFSTSIVFKRAIFYDFIKKYFINFPEVYFKDGIKDLPEREALELVLGYKHNKYTINIFYNEELYSYYPTYILLNNKTETYVIENLKIKFLTYKIELPLKTISLNLEFSHFISPEEILFKPKLVVGLNLMGYIIKNLYFAQKFLYNSKTLLNNFDRYLDENIVSTTELKFFVSENFAFDVLFNLPVKSKFFITPNLFYHPYILFGFNLKFK